MWQFERDDERWGQWKVEIDIQDSDITKEGDQKKSIKLLNLAESIGEFEGQLLNIMTTVDALLALQIKTLAESGMARQEAIKGYLASKAIVKYMAFKSTEIDVEIPMTFTAGAESVSKLLEESTGHVKGTDYVEKETMRDIFLDLLQAAAVTRAVHWQRIDTKKDTKAQLLELLRGTVDLASSIKNPTKPDNGNPQPNRTENFEDFIDNVESGFTNTTGITDIENPYGKTPDRRPRIRQIGENISQAGNNK
jgi:phosphopantetheine adenylyltransferase